ncbi:MFS transporter [Flavobacterium sp. RHBU_3]|uniref:MFS transporter n=1 Tax=Flavobacterium sp. RHBU_3 TaxID=3391184 RepID=UPI003984823F
MEKRKLGFWEIWNMSFGYLGIQMGFALQNANASRILQTFGADVHTLSWFWIIPPLMGLIVQPIIGHYSDRTWTRFGRRKPYFLAGSLLAALGLVFMPQAAALTAIMPALWIGAGFLMIMDASFNVAMEPFRALVADMLPSDQRTLGFSLQTVLIGIGAVIGSWLPYALANWFNVAHDDVPGEVPYNVILSFIIGAISIVVAILITITTTKEYTPKEIEAFEAVNGEAQLPAEETHSIKDIFTDFAKMPQTMRQLSWVQFFSWFGLFGMWVFTTPAIAHHLYGTPLKEVLEFTPAETALYNKAGNWTGIIFGVYNAVSAVIAFFLPAIAKVLGRKKTHFYSLLIGGAGLLSVYFVPNPDWLILSMIGVGVGWASILAMPYAILTGSIPPRKMGVYMGIFNFFVVIPQIVNAIIGGPMVKYVYGGNPIYAIIASGVSFIIAALFVTRVKDTDEPTVKI